jgi:hypothetical protein
MACCPGLKAAGYSPTINEYLNVGGARPQLEGLFAAMGVTPRQAMREKGTPAAELGLLDSNIDQGLLGAGRDRVGLGFKGHSALVIARAAQVMNGMAPN